MASTYEPIATTTLSSAASSITFTGISQSYTDLILIFNGDLTSITGAGIRVGNGSIDTGTNYSYTFIWGNGSSAGASCATNQSLMRWDYYAAGNGSQRNAIFHLQNYSNTTTYKNILSRTAIPSTETLASVGLWRSNSAINQVSLVLEGATTYVSGSTATLYGIKAA